MTISKPDGTPKRKAPKSAFKPGPDPRRNTGGNLNAEAQSYEIRFRNALAEKLPPEEFADIVVEDVRRHRPGAREFYAKYLVGEPVQKHAVDHSGEVKLPVVFVMPRPGAKVEEKS